MNGTYRLPLFIRLFSRVMGLFIQVSIWTALYKGAAEVSSNAGPISLQDMIVYSILSTAISVFVANDAMGEIIGRIRSGQIALDLLKPVRFKSWQMCIVIGSNISSIVLELIPVLLIGVLLFGFRAPPLVDSLFFLVALINGLLINFLLSYTLGLLALWYVEVWQLGSLMQNLIRLFSGAWIPLWFFPNSLVVISDFLPFKYIYFVPTSIFLSKSDPTASVLLILQQFLWIIGLTLVEKFVWRKAVRKLVVQGG